MYSNADLREPIYRMIRILNHHVFLQRTLLLLTFAFIYSATAQQTGSAAGISITSDSNVIRGSSIDSVRVIFYHGNVRITHALIEITGDDAMVTVSSKPNKIMNALVTGNPVNFKEIAVDGTAKVSGISESIEYDILDGQVILEGEVSFSQLGTRYACDKLEYSIETRLALGTNGCQVTITN